MKKKLLRFIILILVVGVFSSFLGYIYLKSTWEDVLSEKELNELVARIEFAEELPERFYELYEEAYPDVLSSSLNKQIANSIFSEDFVKSPSFLASTISTFTRKDSDSTSISRKKAYVLAWKLEEEISQKQCLNWALKNYQFTLDFKGADNIAKYYFTKSLNELNDDEFKGIITLMKKPSIVSISKTRSLRSY